MISRTSVLEDYQSSLNFEAIRNIEFLKLRVVLEHYQNSTSNSNHKSKTCGILKFEKIEELYLEFEKTNNNGEKIIDIFSKYPDIRAVAIGVGRVLAVSEKPEGFSDDYLKGLEDGTKAFVYCFHGNDLCEENLMLYA